MFLAILQLSSMIFCNLKIKNCCQNPLLVFCQNLVHDAWFIKTSLAKTLLRKKRLGEKKKYTLGYK